MNWLITGGSGSFGKAFTKHLLDNYEPNKVIMYSRDELKQSEIKAELNDDRMRFFIGDVRDRDRLEIAFRNVDVVVHAAALKRVPECEYNVSECVATNVYGSQNVVDAAIATGVKKAVLLSTDKACTPINTYGRSKALAESIFVQGNAYASGTDTIFSVVRYGNVVGSRGSVIPLFLEQKKTGVLTVTHRDMTRFLITLEEAVNFVVRSVKDMVGGEIFIPRLPSAFVIDIARAVCHDCFIEYTGIRPGEKLHESLMAVGEMFVDQGDRYVVVPSHSWFKRGDLEGERVLTEYSSDRAFGGRFSEEDLGGLIDTLLSPTDHKCGCGSGNCHS